VSASSSQRRTLRLALADPGAFTPRRRDVGPERDEPEPLTDWQARAVSIYLREQSQSVDRTTRSWLGRGAQTLRKLADKIDERQA
jgi:hypothetical protein